MNEHVMIVTVEKVQGNLIVLYFKKAGHKFRKLLNYGDTRILTAIPRRESHQGVTAREDAR